MHAGITVLKALVNPMQTDTECSPLNELSRARKATIAKGDTEAKTDRGRVSVITAETAPATVYLDQLPSWAHLSN